MSRIRILIVEDEGIIARDIEQQLAHLGYEPVGIAASYDDALALAASTQPQLALMDVNLDGTPDGIEAATVLRRDLGIPSIFLTAYATDDVVARAKASDPLGYLIKPFDEQSLRTTLEIALHKDKVDRQLRNSERRYRAVIESAHDAIVTEDSHGNIVGWSPAATKMFGYSEAEILGQPVARLIPERHHQAHDRTTSQLAAPSDQVATHRLEADALHRDGDEIPVEVSLARWSSEDGAFVTAFIRDIRERRHAESAERQLQERFLQAQKMEVVGRLAGGIAHDFNNILTIINGTSDLALMNLPVGHPMAAMFNEIRDAGDRAARLTRQLLAFSRKQIATPVVVSVGQQITQGAKMLRRLIGEDIQLVIDTPDVGRDTVLIDPGQLEQVLLNLAVNSHDAMPTGGTLTITCQSRDADDTAVDAHPGWPAGPHVRLTIADTGLGMTPDVLAKVFEPFFTTKAHGKGTGLGLATVYGIVQGNGGGVYVESTPGEGTRIIIGLPFMPAAGTEPLAVTAPPLRGTETILLVEDEDGLRDIATRMLRSAGYTVLPTASGSDAIALLDGYPGTVHLMLSDVVMPGLSGPDIAARLALTHPDIKVLFASGYTDDRLPKKTFADPLHFIAKPYSYAELTHKVRDLLDAG